LCAANPKLDELMTEFDAVCRQLDEVLKDLEWRKPDVEGEEATLRNLQARAKKDPGVDVASQAIVVRVLRSVLDDKIAEAERLEQRMLQLKAQIEGAAAPAPQKGKRGKRGQALREKAE